MGTHTIDMRLASFLICNIRSVRLCPFIHFVYIILTELQQSSQLMFLFI